MATPQRRRVDALLRKAVAVDGNEQGAVRASPHDGGYWWREELEEIHEHATAVGTCLWKRARALQPRPLNLTTTPNHGDAAVSRTAAEWVNAAAWQVRPPTLRLLHWAPQWLS
jgi:hypothetical protein